MLTHLTICKTQVGRQLCLHHRSFQNNWLEWDRIKSALFHCIRIPLVQNFTYTKSFRIPEMSSAFFFRPQTHGNIPQVRLGAIWKTIESAIISIWIICNYNSWKKNFGLQDSNEPQDDNKGTGKAVGGIIYQNMYLQNQVCPVSPWSWKTRERRKPLLQYLH